MNRCNRSGFEQKLAVQSQASATPWLSCVGVRSAKLGSSQPNNNSLPIALGLAQFRKSLIRPIHCLALRPYRPRVFKPFVIPGEIICFDGKAMKDKRTVHKDRRSNDCMRSNTDRRSHQKIPETPFKDSEGTKVTYDRCRSPDRRINSIEVEWHENDEESCA